MIFLLLLQQLIGAGSQLTAKYVMASADVYTVLFYRGLIATLLYSGFLLFKRKNLPAFDRKDLPKLVLLSLINVPVNQALFLAGIGMTTAPNSAVIYAFTPIFVLIMSRTLIKERITPLKAIGACAAVAGIVIIMTERGASSSENYLWGNILVFLAAAAWSAYAVLGKELTIKYGAVYSNAVNMIAGYLIYDLIYCFIPTQTDFASLGAGTMAGIVYLGIGTSCASYLILYTVLKKLPPGKVAVFNNLTPVLTTVFAFLLFGTLVTPIFIAGGAVVIAGVTVVQFSKK